MKPRSLRIFKKKKGIYLNPGQWGKIFLTAVLFFLAYLEQSHGYNLDGWMIYTALIWFIYGVVLIISTHFQYEKEFGEYSGQLTLHQDKIQVDETKFELSEIKKLDFIQAFDIRGKFKNLSFEFTPHLSNGLDNVFEITLKSGEIIKENFLQTETERLKHYEKILIHYYKEGIISWLHLIDLLEITEYSKIQEFKEEINN